ncbi:MAG: XdhC family protein [Planctomycetota bacterium]|jgi:xanthine dehydrogenase accessory factor
MTIFEEIAQRTAGGEAIALATVIETEGSSPAQQAMKMLVGPEGRLTGTIGGGRVEADVLETAAATLASGTPAIREFTLDDDLADEGGMICGGTVRILVERVERPATWAADAAALIQTGRRGVLLARIGDTVARELLRGEQAAPFLESDDARRDGDLFIEPLSRPRCVILGAGHVGRAVATIARAADFAVAIVEDREDQAERAKADEVICAPLVDGFDRLEPTHEDYIVIMTRGHGLDRDCARAALASPAKYVGMLASRKKAATIKEALAQEVGARPEDLRLHAPIGLDLGALSAGEIAVSVVAQMIKVRRTGRGDR